MQPRRFAVQAATARKQISELYADHSTWLRSWLRRYTHCPQKAADFTQDTFCRLLELPDAEHLRAARSYLATIARRLVIDDARRVRVETAYLDAQAVLSDGVAQPAPDRIAEAIEELVAVTQALDGLAERPRRAYLLARLEGWNHSEIAAELGVSKSMIKQYIAKAYAHCYAAAYGPACDF
ncbi:MAG: sigma-70 family RNA polymerase sigma factor [Oxalobacteraceae bacterium]|nr:MAG: sigma-70 family RNA polymerase sigma factor [Oxalobacteraceae bacterium]